VWQCKSFIKVLFLTCFIRIYDLYAVENCNESTFNITIDCCLSGVINRGLLDRCHAKYVHCEITRSTRFAQRQNY